MATPRILYFDIETTPNLGYTWNKWQQDVIEFVSEWYILCFSYMWEGDEDARVISLPQFKKQYKANPENDYEVVAALHRLLTEADIVITHNGDKFDIKKANAKFAEHGMGPVAPFQSIDTLKVARQNFSWTSNRLGDIGKRLGLGQKEQTGGFSLWRGCMQGDKSAWDTMISYAKQDTVLLREVYLALRAWHKSHPNLNVYEEFGGTSCPRCGSHSFHSRGYRYTQSGRFQQFQCNNCKGYFRRRLSDKPEEGHIKPTFRA